MKKFKVIAIHPWTGGCDLNCSFCYKSKKPEKGFKDSNFWYSCIPYFSKLTNQIALGADGEPFMDSAFVARFAAGCKKNKILCNVTSNGRKLMAMDDQLLKDTLKDITMISLSFDQEKIKSKVDFENYINLVNRIKKLTKCQVGCNLLINNMLFENGGLNLVKLVYILFENKVDRVFTLYPKNAYFIDILKYRDVYIYLTDKFEYFGIDDLTNCIIEQGYSGWTKSCHYGKSLVSINEKGICTGCSFDCDKEGILTLNKPEDLLKLNDIKVKERFKCPYLKNEK